MVQRSCWGRESVSEALKTCWGGQGSFERAGFKGAAGVLWEVGFWVWIELQAWLAVGPPGGCLRAGSLGGIW